MRHRAHGRHGRYPRPKPVRAWLTAVLAVLAAGLAIVAGTGTFAASAQQQAPVRTVLDRGAENPVSVMSLAQEQAQLTVTRMQLAAARARAALAAATYTVRAGDSISRVAVRHCRAARDWTGIYAASRARGWTARDANTLTAGQHLFLACAYDASQLRFAPAPRPVIRAVAVVSRRSGYRAVTAYHRVYAASYSGSGTMQRCIIARESGGNSQVMNSSGHYGLYQFSYSTWKGSGGSAADFGHASVAEQNRVFSNAVAARGYSDWTPYDHC